jgi:hypothetical protein
LQFTSTVSSHVVQDSMMRPKVNVVINDLRFKTEMNYVQDGGGYIVRIKRPVPEISVGSEHQSENDLVDVPDSAFDYVIEGKSKDVPDLQNKTRLMMLDLPALGVKLPADLLKKREEDVRAGKIRPYNPELEDVPPFMRNK